jgi:hypothetical protein
MARWIKKTHDEFIMGDKAFIESYNKGGGEKRLRC